MMRTILKFLLPLLVVGVGVGVAVKMVKSRPKAKRAKPRKEAMLVDVVTVHSGSRKVVVEATGSVVPERTVMLQPEISGVIRSEADAFEVGRRFKQGDELVHLDTRDLRLAIKQRRAAVTAAKVELTMERGRAELAKQEWKMLGSRVRTTAAGKALSLRKPQKEAARARIAQAEVALDQARLNLTRTAVKAPFDCIVREKRAALGQLVSPASPIATLVDTRRFFVNVSVPVGQLPSIRVPGLNAKEGARVRVLQQREDETTLARAGRVVRLLSDLDPNGRMARLVVAVDDPLDAPPGVADGQPWLPLLLGSYVRVEIEGRSLDNVIPLPRLALREGDRVWVAKDGKLDERPVRIAWREKRTVLVREGLQDGDRVVTSRIPSPLPGMALRVRGDARVKAASTTEKAAPAAGPAGERTKAAPAKPAAPKPGAPSSASAPRGEGPAAGRPARADSGQAEAQR